MAHIHGGKSSSLFLPAKKILAPLKLTEKDIVLDAGCGIGHLSREAAKTALKVYAFDMHKPSIDYALKKKTINMDVRLVDLNQIPLADSSVDIVILSNVLHGFVENKENKALSEIKRVLTAGGRMLVVEFKMEAVFGPPKKIRLSPKDVEKVLGMKIVEKVNMLFHYAVVLKFA